jgi:hypothetical protein
MTNEQKGIHSTRRGRHAADVVEPVATTRSGAVATKDDGRRMSAWLRGRGEPNYSAFKRRRH